MAVTVYENQECRARLAKDLERFEKSVNTLKEHGISLEVVSVSGIEDIEPNSETYEIVSKEGLGILPVTEYEGVCVTKGEYPTDQELADYLDVPDGVLSANKYSMAAANDMESSCNCCCHRN